MKIEAKDFRIGNWVVNNKRGYNYYFQVDYDGIGRIYEDDSVAEGIPLTPEILEKAGCSQYNDGYLLPVDDNGYRIHIRNASSIMGDNYYLFLINMSNGVELRFVHQLQNLYYCLTGQELNIEL